MVAFGFMLIWLFVLAIPCENLFVIEGIGTVGRFLGLLSFTIGTFILICFRKINRMSMEYWVLYVFFLWALTTCAWSINYELSFARLWTYCQLMLMVWLLWQWTLNIHSVHKLLGAYIGGAFISIYVTISNYISGKQVVWQRYSATGFDPNELGLIIALGIPVAWYLSFEVSTKFRLLLRLYFVAAWIAILLTASRTAFICAILSCFYIFYSQNRMTIRTKILLFFLSIVFLPFLYNFIPKSSLERISSIGSEISSGTLNKRTQIWHAGFNVLIDNPIGGTGIGTYSTAVKKQLKGEAVAHNLFLTIAVEQGLVGFILFAIFLLSVGFRVLRMPTSQKRFWLSVLMVWSVGVLTLTWDGRKITWLLLTLPLAHGRFLSNKIDVVGNKNDEYRS